MDEVGDCTSIGTLGRDNGRIWWLSQAQVYTEGTIDGSCDLHKHVYIRKETVDRSMDCQKHRYIRKGQWTGLVIVTSIGTLARNYERVWWLPKAHVYLAGTVDGSGDRHKHTYIQKRLWTDLVITTIISKLGRDHGLIWWLPQAQVH